MGFSGFLVTVLRTDEPDGSQIFLPVYVPKDGETKRVWLPCTVGKERLLIKFLLGLRVAGNGQVRSSVMRFGD